MYVFNQTVLLLLGLLSAISNVTAFWGAVVNNCPYGIYAWTDADHASCSEITCSSNVVYIPSGGGDPAQDPSVGYRAAYDPVDGALGGITIKLATENNKYVPNAQIYQIEYSIKDGRLWYDLSHVDGSPFVGVPRYMSVGPDGVCPSIFCPAGSEDCEWQPGDINVLNCDVQEYLRVWIC